MCTTCSNIKNICIFTHSGIFVLHTSHKKCEFFPCNNLKPFFFVMVTVCDVYNKVFYKILNFRLLSISAVLSRKVPRDSEVTKFQPDQHLIMSP